MTSAALSLICSPGMPSEQSQAPPLIAAWNATHGSYSCRRRSGSFGLLPDCRRTGSQTLRARHFG